MITFLNFILFRYTMCSESIGIWVRGCHKPTIVGAKLLTASLSDVIPVVLCRYLSLTAYVGELFVIQQGQPESNRINTIVICELPDRLNPMAVYLFTREICI